MWCGRLSSPQLVHSFGFAAVSESCARRLLRRDFETLFCWTAMTGAFVIRGVLASVPNPVFLCTRYGRVAALGKAARDVQP